MEAFVAGLNGLGRWLWDQLWHMSAELAILAVVVYLAVLVLRVKSPAVRHLFWCLVLAKPVAVFLVASPLSLYWFLQPDPPPPAPVITQAAPAIGVPYHRFQGAPGPRPGGNFPSIAPEAERASAWRALDVHGALALAWMAVAGALALRLAAGWFYVLHLRRTASPVREGPMHAVFGEARAALGVRRHVTLALSDLAHGPALAGVLRPLILIPRGLTQRLGEAHLRLIVAHELAHVRRHDNLLLLIQRLAEVFLFFHPIVWICGRIMRREADAACDDAVLRAYGASEMYADSLARVAEMRWGVSRRMLVNTFAADESDFARRVRRVLRGRRRRMTFGLTALTLSVLVAVASVGLPTATKRSETEGVDTTSEEPAMKEAESAERHVLEGVPIVGWWSNVQGREDSPAGPEDVPFPSCVRAIMQYLGDHDGYVTYRIDLPIEHPQHPGTDARVDKSWVLAMATSGAAFSMSWGEGWQGDNPALHYIANDPAEPYERALRAAGYDFEIIHKEPGRDNEAYFRQRIMESIQRGVPVIAHGVVGPPDACIIAGYDEGGDVLVGWSCFQAEAQFAEDVTFEPNGYFRKARWFDDTESLIILGGKKERPAFSQVVRDTLQWALTVSRAPYHATYGTTRANGIAAYDAWADALTADADFDPEGIDQLRGKLGVYLSTCTIIAEGRWYGSCFLRMAAEDEPDMAEDLLVAARHYKKQHDLIWKLWEVITFDDSPEGLRRSFAPNARARAADLLRQMRGEEVEAMAAIEEALAKVDIMPGPLTVAGPASDVVIEGVPIPKWGAGEDNTVIAALKAVLDTIGDPQDYAYLMGVSGAAFKIQVSESGWCPSSPHALVGLDNFTPAMKALGYSYQAYTAKEGDRTAIEERCKAIVDSIDRGWPVLYQPEECGIIAGYRDGGGLFLYRPYMHGDEEYQVLDDFGWAAVHVLDPKASPLPRKEAILEGLKLAVEQAWTSETRGEDEGARYRAGFSAWQAWIRELAAADFLPGLTEESREGSQVGNAWIMVCLLDAREAAARFLRQAAGAFEGETADHIQAAADAYQKVYETLEPARELAPFPWDEREWTQEMRKAQSVALWQAMAHEKEAIDAIEKALEAEDVDVTELKGNGPVTSGDAVRIGDVPPAKGAGNWFARGLETILGHAGTNADYDTIMGDTGLAFITQAWENAPLIDGAPDVGWWPLDSWGLRLRTEFLGHVVGREVQQGPSPDLDAYRADPAAYYLAELAPLVRASIDRGHPVLTDMPQGVVVTAYDSGSPPLWGRCAVETEAPPTRLDAYPWRIFLLGDPVEAITRAEADRASLAHAIDLWRDAFEGGVSGERAFALWCKALRDLDHLGEARWHANMCGNLSINRQSAVNYLRAMAARRSEAGERLNAAADHYAREVRVLANADTSPEALSAAEGRERLARLAEEMAGIEAEAIAEIAAALAEISDANRAELDGAAHPRTLTVPGVRQETLGGTDYVLVPVRPSEVGLLPLVSQGTAPPREPEAPYADIADPLYNIHCEAGPVETTEQTKARLDAAGKTWPDYWRDLAEGVTPKDQPIAFTAYVDSRVAGKIRFFPSDKARPRLGIGLGGASPSGALLVTSAYVDPKGVEDKLDAALLERVVAYAREEGYASIIAVGWNEARVHAMWAEQFPASVYRAAGFVSVQKLASEDGGAWDDMLAGAHGPAAQRLAVDAGLDPDQITERHLMVLDLNAPSKEAPMAADTASAERGANIVQGVPPLSWADGHDCTFIGALEAALAATDRPWSYADLMGVSGLAFRVRWYQGNEGQRWCPSSPVGEFPEEFAALARATGWQLAVEVGPEDAPHMERFRDRIVTSIDAGLPVLAYDPAINMGTVFGYKDNGAVLLMREFMTGKDTLELPPEDLGFMVAFLGERTAPQAASDALIDSLKMAASYASRGPLQGPGPNPKGQYLYGAEAYDQWIAILEEDMDRLSDQERASLFHVNWWNFSNVLTARDAACAYLEGQARDLDGGLREGVLKAVRIYREGRRKMNEGGAGDAAFLGPWTGKSVADWTPAVRARERAILAEAKAMDLAAAAAIRDALAAEGIEAPRDVRAATPTKMLPDLRWVPRWTSLMGCLEGCLRRLGMDTTPAWLYGGTGHAFVINIHPVLCLSGPTAWNDAAVMALGRNVGFSVEDLNAPRTAEDFPAIQRKAFDQAREAIDAGLPVLTWEMSIPEFYVVNGYDDTGYYYNGALADDGAGPKPWQELATTEIGWLRMTTVRRRMPAEDRKTVRAAIAFALDHANHGEKYTSTDYSTGLAGYDAWIRFMETDAPEWEGQTLTWDTIDGVEYNAAVWHECRQFAAAFLEEAKQRICKGSETQALAARFDAAIGHYREVASQLEAVCKLFPFHGERPPRTPEQRARAAKALRAARAAEAEGLKSLEDLLASL